MNFKICQLILNFSRFSLYVHQKRKKEQIISKRNKKKMETEFYTDDETIFSPTDSISNLDYIDKCNVIFSVALILVGLLGNSLVVFVFGQRRFRRNSNSVFLLCMAVNDSLYLVLYFSQDILKAFREVFLHRTDSSMVS